MINYYSSNQVLFKLLSCDSTKLRVDVLRLATELRQLRFLLSPFHFVLYQKIYLAIKRSLHKSKYVKYIFVSFYYDFHYFLNLTYPTYLRYRILHGRSNFVSQYDNVYASFEESLIIHFSQTSSFRKTPNFCI